jgi:hypothetical protein
VYCSNWGVTYICVRIFQFKALQYDIIASIDYIVKTALHIVFDKYIVTRMNTGPVGAVKVWKELKAVDTFNTCSIQVSK